MRAVKKDFIGRPLFWGVLIFLTLFLFYGYFSQCSAYYGTGLYGSSVYGSGIYGSINRLYGLGGQYGLGSLYGLNSLYGMGGLYGGMIGLYGLGGLYSLSGLSGLSSQNGLGSLYSGMMGLYGLQSSNSPAMRMLGNLLNLSNLYSIFNQGSIYSPGGLFGLGGLGLNSSLGTLGLLSNLGTLSLTPTITNVTAEQAGIWTGAWTSYVKLTGGPMNMTLVEDLDTGLLAGEVTLILNKYTSSLPADVSGIYTGGTSFVLTGDNAAAVASLILTVTGTPLYYIELTCTLTSSTTMEGTYLIRDPLKLSVDYGAFNLNLTSTAVI